MADNDRERKPTGPSKGIGWTYKEHRRRQTRRGLDLTPSERLRWLEETMVELREIQGRASSP